MVLSFTSVNYHFLSFLNYRNIFITIASLAIAETSISNQKTSFLLHYWCYSQFRLKQLVQNRPLQQVDFLLLSPFMHCLFNLLAINLCMQTYSLTDIELGPRWTLIPGHILASKSVNPRYLVISSPHGLKQFPSPWCLFYYVSLSITLACY